jgi:hypothetical protein
MTRTGINKNTIRCKAAGKETRKEDVQDRETRLKGLQCNGEKKQASNARDRWERSKFVLEGTVQSGCSAVEDGGGGEEVGG